MIIQEELNEDQQISFDQMTSSGGLSDKEALELIQEITVDKHQTGLRVTKFKLTSEGQKAARELAAQAKKE